MKQFAVAYYRTSSATNVGTDKDSLKRQQEAVQSHAKANKIKVVGEFYDAAVSGADPIDVREGFSDMLAYMAGNGAKTILCENASRFARDLTVQLTGHSKLQELGYVTKSSLTKDVTILVNESGVESAKTKKARESGVEIITNLLDFIGE